MSTIRKKPFIKQTIESLNATMIASLQNVLDTSGNSVDTTFGNMPNVNSVTPVIFKLDENNYKQGILIYTSQLCVLIAYHRYQDLLIYNINLENSTYNKINEYLDINELRRLIESPSSPQAISTIVTASGGLSADISEDGNSFDIHMDLTGAEDGNVLKHVAGEAVWGKALTLETANMIADSSVYASDEPITTDECVHIIVDIDTNTTHSVISADLIPYSQGTEHLAYMRGNVGGSMVDIPAYLSESGHIVVDTSTLTITGIGVKYFVY